MKTTRYFEERVRTKMSLHRPGLVRRDHRLPAPSRGAA